MSFALTDELRRYIDDRVRSGEYGNTSEYLRELIRRDQERPVEWWLRSLIADRLESGDGRPATAHVIPVGWFDFVLTDHADVVRLLSDARDLPVMLADLDTD